MHDAEIEHRVETGVRFGNSGGVDDVRGKAPGGVAAEPLPSLGNHVRVEVEGVHLPRTKPAEDELRADTAPAADLERSPTRPEDVARAITRALTESSPRMRYVVGRGARVVIALRRYLPQSLFERLYFGGHIRRLERRTRGAELPPVAETLP